MVIFEILFLYHDTSYKGINVAYVTKGCIYAKAFLIVPHFCFDSAVKFYVEGHTRREIFNL